MEEQAVKVQESGAQRLAYGFRPGSGEFTSVLFPQQYNDQWLLPADATWQKPPELSDHHVAVFDPEACSWSVKADYRGIKYWHKRTREQFTIQEIDCYPDTEWTDQDPAQVDLNFVQFDDGNNRWIFNQEAKDQADALAAAADAAAYLRRTDWYVIRKVEKAEEIPADVLAARDQARAAIDAAEVKAPGIKQEVQA